MSRMGERFLVLDEAAAALDAVDPQSAAQFRLTNGLPAPLGADGERITEHLRALYGAITAGAVALALEEEPGE